MLGLTGLTLTAASHVIHFDRWWNPAVEDRATDRAFRIGQTKNVLLHKFRGAIREPGPDNTLGAPRAAMPPTVKVHRAPARARLAFSGTPTHSRGNSTPAFP